jgi:hypothetical protein
MVLSRQIALGVNASDSGVAGGNTGFLLIRHNHMESI